MRSNRIKAIQISPKAFVHFLVTGKVFEIMDGIPHDCELRGFNIDARSNSLLLFVEHKSFPECPEHSEFPKHTVTVRKVDGEALKVFRRMTEVQEPWNETL